MLRAVVPFLACALALPLTASADERASMLSSLRPATRADLPLAEIGPLSDLPLYDLDLSLRDDLSAYALRETIDFTNTTGTALSEIVLRLFANRGATPAVSFESGQCGKSVCTIEQPRASVLKVRLASALAPGAKLTLQLQLRGQLRVVDTRQTDLLQQGIEGLGAMLSSEQSVDYGLLSLGDGIASLAHFYAVIAQRNGSGWVSDEQKPFGDVGASGLSFVRAAVHVPQDVVVASSGVSAEPNDARTQHITAALVRDFALVAGRDLRVRSRMIGDVNVRAYYLTRDADGGGRVLDTAANALTIFEHRFGPYPYVDLDVVEATLVGGAGGCEFSGMVTIASMLYRPLPSGPLAAMMPSAMLELTTAHEVAHQYWYGLVGSDARTHPFQDESLTQWSARLYFEDRFGAERGAREADTQIAMNYRAMRMLGENDGAVDRPVDAFDSALSYAGLVYGKGAYLYPALRKLLGDDAFFDALRWYARQYRFQSAPPAALFDRMALGSGRAGRVRSLAAHWLVERHGDRDLGTGPAAISGSHPADLGRFAGALLGGTASANGTEPHELEGKPSANNADLEALQHLLGESNLGADSVNLEQLQSLLRGLLPGASAGGQVDPEAAQKLLESLQHAPDAPREQPDAWHELEGEPNERGM